MDKVSSEKMQVREKVEKSRNTVFFYCYVAPEGRKAGSLKRRTPLFSRITFGRENVEITTRLGHFWKL